jgi:hypothetical protein
VCKVDSLSFFPGADAVVIHVTKSLRCLLAASFIAVVTFILQGCAPEGAGTIKIEDPNGIRSKMGGGGEVKTKKPLGSDAAKVKEEEKNAPTKHFQRG